MLLRQTELEGILLGRVQLIFRCWGRANVKAGGSLLTPIGKLNITAVDEVERSSISEDDARRASYGSLAELRAAIDPYPLARVFRVTLGPLEADPRIALRSQAANATEAAAIALQLNGLDRRADQPWTQATLEVIERRPETRAATLAREVRRDREAFKLDVRKLKTLGLTESLDVGYRLSPRGQSVLAWLRARATPVEPD